jgi:hypothetical protein
LIYTFRLCKSVVIMRFIIGGIMFHLLDLKRIYIRYKQKKLYYRLSNDLLSHTLRCSTISAKGFHYRVRNGIECFTFAIITKPIIESY